MFNTTNNGTEAPPDASVEELSGTELYQAGALHFKNRDYDAARACFERHLEQNPADPAALHLLARVCYHQNKDLEKAEECLKKALEIDHSSTTGYLETLGMIYISQGRYERAAEVFEYALSEDRKDDGRHTASLEYYLDLARKKNKAPNLRHAEESPMPEFLVTDMGRWHTRNRQPLFLLPSIILHAIIFLLVGYLSTHNLPFKKDKEDFTYVEVEQPAEAPQEAATPERPGKAAPAPAPTEEGARKTPAPAPVSPGKEVKTSDVRKESSTAQAPAPIKGTGESGQRGTVGHKSIAGVKGSALDKTMLARAMPGDKGSQIRTHSPGMSAGEVDLVKKSLSADTSGSKGAGGPKAAAPSGLNERSGGAAATGSDGIFLGDSKTSKTSRWDKERHSRLGGGSIKEARSEPGVNAGGEKSLDLGRKKEKSFASNQEAGLAARPLGIAAGPSSPAAASAGAGAPRSLDKDELATARAGAGQAAGFGTGPSSGKDTAGGGKIRGSLGNAASPETASPVTGGNERRVDLSGQATGRRFAYADAVPLRRGLDMPAGGRPGAGTPGAAGGSRENIASLDRKAAGGATASQGMGAAGLTPGRPGVEGNMGAPAGKGVNSRALAGQPEGEGAGLSGLLEKTARRVSGALGLGGARDLKQGPSGADLRRAGGMAGLAGSGGYSKSGSGQGSGGNGTGTGGGVRLGSGERGAAQPGTARAGDVGSGSQTRKIAGGKKMTEGALGTPGGSDAERLASAGATQARPAGIEKRSGVGRGRALAKNTIGPSVSITSPVSGRTNRLTQVVTGTVTDSRTKKAILTVNNDSRVISVENGRFESTVSLGKGRNTVTVMAFDLDGNMGKDIVVLDYAEPSESASITIASPRQGQVFDVSERSVISVKGTIGDPQIKRAKLIFNGNPMDVVVNRGYFDQKVALVEEQNTLLVEAVSSDGVISRSGLITVNTMNVKPKDIMLILSWDKPHADFDLHVYGPMGGHTFYKNPNIYESKDAIAGGQLEQDAKGNFGPEVYTQDHADKGVYTVSSNYYYSGGDGDAHATLTVILYGDNPSRRIVRVFGPHLQVDTKNGEDTWEVTRFKMPEGIFLED